MFLLNTEQMIGNTNVIVRYEFCNSAIPEGAKQSI